MKNIRIPYKTTMYYVNKKGERIDLAEVEWRMGQSADTKVDTFNQTIEYKQKSEIEDLMVEGLIKFDHEERK